MTTAPASGDRETEAAIRKRIAEEVREAIAALGPEYFAWDVTYRLGLTDALRIIERDSGVAAEGEQG